MPIKETKVPALPDVSGIEDPQIRKFLAAVKELLEVRDGRRGDELDQFVKLRDLTDAGVINFNKRTSGPGAIENPLGDVTDYTQPPALLHFTVTGGYTIMFLNWDYLGPLNYANFSHVEIWRSATNVIGAALLIGETTANLYSDSCGSGMSFYYWVRAMSKAGVAGPYNAVSGTFGQTAADVPFLLTTLTNQITQTQLYSTLSSRIDLIDASAGVVGSVNERIATEREATDGSFAAYDERVTLIEDENEATASTLDVLIAGNATNSASIFAEETARVNADSALTISVNGAISQAGLNSAAIITESSTRASADTALGDSITTVANSVTTLTTTVGGNTASIQTQATSIGGLQAQYTVKTDVNGYISGYGLATTTVNGVPTSTFIMRADVFSVGGAGVSTVTPFAVVSTPQIINGVTVPVGVYMDAAYIKEGTITNAKIGNLAVDNAKVANLSADKVTFGEMSGDRIAVNTLRADRIIANTLGAKLLQVDTAYVGTANVGDGVITNAKIGNVIQSSNYLANVQGWILNKDGTVEFGGGKFRGDITGASGTFSGTLSGNTITGANISGTTVSGGTITGALINAGTLQAGIIKTGSKIYDATSSYELFSTAITGWQPSNIAVAITPQSNPLTILYGPNFHATVPVNQRVRLGSVRVTATISGYVDYYLSAWSRQASNTTWIYRGATVHAGSGSGNVSHTVSFDVNIANPADYVEIGFSVGDYLGNPGTSTYILYVGAILVTGANV